MDEVNKQSGVSSVANFSARNFIFDQSSLKQLNSFNSEVKMSCPTVQKGCGCIDLETAGITMGVLDVILRVSHAYIILNTEQRDI